MKKEINMSEKEEALLWLLHDFYEAEKKLGFIKEAIRDKTSCPEYFKAKGWAVILPTRIEILEFALEYLEKDVEKYISTYL